MGKLSQRENWLHYAPACLASSVHKHPVVGCCFTEYGWTDI